MTSQAPSEPTAEDGDSYLEPMPRLRRLIAARMLESLQTSAQLTTVVEVDITRVADFRRSVKHDFAARVGTKLSYLPFLAPAAIEALQAYPIVNAALAPDGKSIEFHRSQHLGIAVDTEGGCS